MDCALEEDMIGGVETCHINPLPEFDPPAWINVDTSDITNTGQFPYPKKKGGIKL